MKFRVGRKCIGAFGMVLLSGLAGTAHAERVSDKGWIQAGIYYPKFDSDGRIDSVTGPGTGIDFEDDLNVDDRKVVADITAGWRISNKFRLEGEYFPLNRRGSTTLSRNINWGEAVYPANAVVESGFDTDMFRAAIGYSFVRNENTEFGVRIGAHVTTSKLFIEGQASVAGGATQFHREQTDATVPLPNGGLYVNYDLSPVWTLSGSADYFDIKVGNYKGGITNLAAGVTARVAPHIGIGARFRYVDYRLKAESDSWVGKANSTFFGPALYLEAAF